MRIIFMGTPEFAVPSLEILYKNDHKIVGVVTVPDKRKGRGLIVSASPVKQFAIAHNIKTLQPDKLKDPIFIGELKNLKPDLIVVVAFRILPKEMFAIPASGIFNLHASLLPKYRGAAPINHALINGEKETGVTTFFLKEKVDTGNVILQRSIAIDENENAGSLHDKLSVIGAQVVLETVKLIEDGNVNATLQDDSLATPAPKIFKENCGISWNQSVKDVHNFIRGLSPYPAAYTTHNDKIVKIYKSRLTDIPSDSHPGSVKVNGKHLLVATKDNYIQIDELMEEGRKKISSLDFINGIIKNEEIAFK